MQTCHTSFLLKSTLLFSNKSDCGNHVRTFTHEKLGRIFGHTGSPRSLLSELSANLRPEPHGRAFTICAATFISRATSEPARETFHHPAGGRPLSAARLRLAIP